MLTWQAHAGAVTSLAFVPGGGLLSTGTDGVLKHWDPTGGSLHDEWKLADEVTKSVTSNLMCALPDASGRYAAIGVRGTGVRFLELGSGKEDEGARVPIQLLLNIAPAPDKSSIFIVGRNLPTASRHSGWVTQRSYLPGSRLAVSKDEVSGDRLIIKPDLSEVIAGRDRFRWPDGVRIDPPLPLLSGNQFVVTPDGDKLFGVNGRYLTVWGYQVCALRRKLKGHVAPITGLTTTPDGRRLWTASADATVRQWDVDSYRCTQCYGLKIGPLGCVAVSPDGLTAAAGSSHNGHIAVWDLD